jgi:nucleoid DNA-binding protein
MQIEHYISELLYRYDCVILPEFGAFLTQHQSAQVHHTTHAFYPPKKKLSFNSALVDNDGLLANYIAKLEMIPHKEANAKIASYVRKLWDGLHKGENQEVKNVGGFHLSEDNQLQFEPSYHLNYLTSSFGLCSFTNPVVTREVYKEQIVALEKKAPIAFTPERRSKGWLKYAAIALIGLSIAGAGGFKYIKDVEAHNMASQEEAKELLDTKIQEATFVIDNPLPAITLELIKPQGKYHVIAGAFRMEENAQKRVNQLRAKGYKARQIGANKYGLHQVVYGSYSDSQKALDELRTIRKEDNKEAWLLVKTLE